MPKPAAIDFKSEKSLSTDDISLLKASLGGPDDPVIDKRALNSWGIDEDDIIIIDERCAEFILKLKMFTVVN